jgi:putative molybdopterin biosynthesis protein
VEDLARRGLTIINRELGSGARALLDQHLAEAGIDAEKVKGYHRTALGHLPAAWHVYSGMADCCVATGIAARVFGLDFVPLVAERYDLVIRREHLNLPAMQAMLDTLNRSAFRRELAGLGGYDTSATGQAFS